MSHRTWMYSGWQHGKTPSNYWIDQTTEFLNHAFSFPGVGQNDTIKYPCAMCCNYFRHKRFTVELHLCKHMGSGKAMKRGHNMVRVLLGMMNAILLQMERVLIRLTKWIKCWLI